MILKAMIQSINWFVALHSYTLAIFVMITYLLVSVFAYFWIRESLETSIHLLL